MVLTSPVFQSEAVVRAHESERILSVCVNGEQARSYLSVLRGILLGIHRTFEKLSAEEQVPLPDAHEVVVSYAHLIRLEREGIETVYPDGAVHAYRVRDLLGCVYVDKKLTRQEIALLLESIVLESDTEDAATEKLQDMLILQPNFFGMGVDLGKLVRTFMGRRK